MATIRWTGAAQDIQQVQTVTVANTWAAADTGTLTINNKSLTVTVGTAVTTTDVASAIAAAVNSPLASQGLVGDETKNFGGQEIPEFREVIATSSGAVVTLKSRTPGQPFTLTVSEVTAGTGTLATAVTTAATGSTFLSNAANYSTGTVPVDNDTLVFAEGSASVLNALDHFRTNNIDLNIVITGDYTGQIGRPAVNPGGYAEYRSRYFQYRGGSKTLDVVDGVSNSLPTGSLWIDLQDQAGVAVTLASGRGGSPTAPTISICGADAATLTNTLVISPGCFVAIEPDDAPTGATKYATFARLGVGATGAGGSPTVVIGRNARMSVANAIFEVNSGTVVSYAQPDGTSSIPVRVNGGSLTLMNSGGSAAGYIDVHPGATLYIVGSTACEQVVLYGGAIDASKSPLTAGSFGSDFDIRAFAGSTINDPKGLLGSTIHLVGCRISNVTLSLPADRQLVMSAAATAP